MSVYITITWWNLLLLEVGGIVLLDTIDQSKVNIYILMVKFLFITELSVYELV